MKKSICVMFVILIAVLGCGCRQSEPNTETGVYFDTVVSLSVYGEDVPPDAMKLCKKYDSLLSKTNKQSDVCVINSSGKANLNPETVRIIEAAVEISKISGGAFDITTAPLSELWNFSAKKPKIPVASQISEALKKVNYKNIFVNGNEVTLASGTQIDLGGIAKGYIADRIGEIYKKNNLSGIINLGGNVLLCGTKPDNSKYSVGIKKPYTENEYVAKIQLTSGSVVTSGVYERGFTVGKKYYHHLLSTKTGYPVQNGLDSVTIIAPDSTSADALSTAVFCMGEKDGAALIESLEDTYAVFLKTDGSLIITDGLNCDNGIITLQKDEDSTEK